MHPHKSNLPKKESVVPPLPQVCSVHTVGVIELRVSFDSQQQWKAIGSLEYDFESKSLTLENVTSDDQIVDSLRSFCYEVSQGAYLMTSDHELIELGPSLVEEGAGAIALTPAEIDGLKTSIEAITEDAARLVVSTNVQECHCESN